MTLTPDAGFVVKRKDEYFLIAEEPATADPSGPGLPLPDARQRHTSTATSRSP